MANRTDVVSDGKVAELPLQANVKVEVGNAVVIGNQSLATGVKGHIKEAATTAEHRPCGVALDTVDNTGGAAGAKSCRVGIDGRTVEMTVDTGSISKDDIGREVHVSGTDGDTFTFSGTVRLGELVGIVPDSTTRAYIKLDPFQLTRDDVQSVTADDSDSALNQILPESTGVTIAGVTNGVNDYVVLPSLAKVPIGHSVAIVNASGGNCELRTPATSGEKINNVDSDGTNEYLVTDADTVVCTKTSATTWIAVSYTNLGAVRTAVVPD